MTKFPVITIDGPAASGKSTVSRKLAQELGWNWVSTGAFYRGLTMFALRKGVSLDDENALARAARDERWRVVMTPDKTCVLIDDEDVTLLLEADLVGTNASRVSRLPKVRLALLELQRQCGDKPPGLVAEGRDCGTVVFPYAVQKIYLTASNEERALRRSQQVGADLMATLESQKQRDERDMTRSIAPLEVPAGATLIDTSQMTLDQVVQRISDLMAPTPTVQL